MACITHNVIRNVISVIYNQFEILRKSNSIRIMLMNVGGANPRYTNFNSHFCFSFSKCVGSIRLNMSSSSRYIYFSISLAASLSLSSPNAFWSSSIMFSTLLSCARSRIANNMHL